LLKLRPVEPGDLPTLFEYSSDPESNRLVGFVPRTRAEFDKRWETVMPDSRVIKRAVVVGGELAGDLCLFDREGRRELGYWFGRRFWGKGLATEAVRLFLAEISERPIHAVIAKHNAGSRRVAEKCGFELVGETVDVNKAGERIELFVFELR
jgi:RimJ/RimL family protein N-acetyltransferase